MTKNSQKDPRGGPRPGSGRPHTLEDPVRVTVSLERSEVERLDAIAAKNELTRNDVVRQAIRAWLAHSGRQKS
jgi:hypothetical protein